VVVGDLVDIASRPPTQPQVVGAAAARRSGTRPIPTTPAAKAAALTAQATGGSDSDDGVTLAEEGPRSRRATLLRLAALVVVLVVVVAGSSYAVYAWSQRQYYLAAQDGMVAVFRGVDQNLGPISLSDPEYSTTIAIGDLPPSYQGSLKQGIEVDDRSAADARVAELRLQAQACRWAQLNGEVCRTVPSTWTAPSPSPTPTSTTSTGAAPSGSPSGSPTGSPSPSPSPTLSPSSNRSPSVASTPVTS
jgi:protein phosphatase